MKELIQKHVLPLLLFSLITFSTSAVNAAGCSDAGVASTTKDSICVNGSTSLILTGYVGAIQWQSFDGTTWVDEVLPGATTDNYTVTLTATTDFRAVVTDVGCPSDTSNVQTITVGVSAPTTTGATRCGYGPITLDAIGSGIFKWYDTPTGGTPLYTGSSFTTNVGVTTDFYCAAASSSGGSGTTPMPAQTSTFSSNARGYFFTAPSDFTITGLFIPGSNGALQNIAVIRFVPAVPPPIYATTTDDFATLFLTQSNPATGVIPVNIPIFAGDVIGVLGTRGPGDVNSYAPGPYNTTIDGQTVAIARMGMQFPLSTTAPQQIWQEVGGSISRVEITYEKGCESARTVTTATVTAPPAITLSATPPALCQGQTSTLNVASGNPGYTYTWSPATGLSGTSGSSVTATPLAPITYTVTANDGTCGNVDSIFISVGPASVAGTATISTDTICLGSNATLFLAGSTGNIQWQSYDGSMWNNETGPGSTTAQYLVSPTNFTQYRAVVTSGGCDPDTTTAQLNLEVIAIVDPTTVNDTICGPGIANLLSNGAGVMNWFIAPTGGASVHTGNTYGPTVSATTTYYVEASAGGTYNVGAPNSGIGTQFALAGNDWGMQFDVTQQVTIDKVYVSPGGTSGNITINLREFLGGPVVNTVTTFVNSFSGLQPINLGFTVQPGTGYRLEMAASSVPCYYNSFGAVYPYTFAGSSVTITGYVNPNFASGTFYYFFYNWEITEGCKSNRVPVTCVVNPAVATPTIVQNGTILTSSSPTGNQWYNNGVLIPGATGISYDMTLSGSGNYTVVVTDATTGCSAESLPVVYTGINENLAAAGISVFPNPVKDVLTIQFQNAQNITAVVTIYNKIGEAVYSGKVDGRTHVIPMNFASGTYAVEIKTPSGTYSTRILKL